MFGFWKKKGGEVPEEQQWQRSAEQRAKERQQAAEIPQALRTLGQDFLPEELEILAVTGANPFSGSQGEEGEGLWPDPGAVLPGCGVRQMRPPDGLGPGGEHEERYEIKNQSCIP